jgi:hypothetical protein
MEAAHDPLAKDVEIRKAMWEGQVPIVFQLNPDEVTSLQPPEPYYISSTRLPFQLSFYLFTFYYLFYLSFIFGWCSGVGRVCWLSCACSLSLSL